MLPAQDDDAIIGWNLFNEPRCNCDPTVISQSGQITSEGSGSDCSDVAACSANMKVRHHFASAHKCSCVLWKLPLQLQNIGRLGMAWHGME
jgi:hypothetical protein